MVEKTLHRQNSGIKVQQYRLALIRVPAAAAAAPPDSLWRPGQSTDPRPHWFGTHQIPGRFCRTGRWSQTELGSWTGSRDAAAASCAGTR